MADASSIIKEFYLSLGWQVDESSFRKYSRALKDTDNSLLAVGLRLSAVATAAFVFTERMADSMEKLYFATRRTGTTAAEFQGLQLSIANAGGSAAAAAGSMEAFSRFLRYTPGASNWLKAHGVDEKGLSNAAVGIEELRNRWLKMSDTVQGRAQSLAESQMAGIDFSTFQALLSPDYADETARVKRTQDMFGLGPDALKNAHEFKDEVRDMEQVLVSFGQWLESDLNGPMKDFVGWLQTALTGMQSFIERAQTEGWHAALGEAGDATASGLSGFWNKLMAGNDQIGAAVSNAGVPDWIVHGLGWKTADEVQNGVKANYLGNRTQQDRAQQAMGYFMSPQGGGYSPAQAAALTAQIQTESSFNETADSVDPKTGMHHVGIAQWDDTRRAEFRHLYGHDINTATYSEQLAYMAHELNEGRYASVGATLRRMNDPASASDYLDDKYEASGDGIGGHSLRAARAQNLAANVTVNIHGNADEHNVREGINKAYSDISRNFLGGY